jgi:hypothetical protein
MGMAVVGFGLVGIAVLLLFMEAASGEQQKLSEYYLSHTCA